MAARPPPPSPAVHTDDPVVARVVRRVVEEVAPLRIILFGSRAMGTATPESDVDLLIVVPDGTPRRPTAQHLYRRIWDADVAADFLVTTPTELARDADNIGLIYPEILRTGRDVYAAP